MRNRILWALTFCLFVFPPFAAAEVQINGFASIVSGIDFEDEGQGAYGNRTVDNLQESKVALQWTADLEKGIRFVGQTMARGNATTGFSLNYDWAYFDWPLAYPLLQVLGLPGCGLRLSLDYPAYRYVQFRVLKYGWSELPAKF